MVNRNGAQFWRYKFELGTSPKEGMTGAEVFIYDHSEEGARAKIKAWFDADEAELLERKTW